MVIDILGTPYTIEEHLESEDELLQDSDGYCDWTIKKIVVVKDMNGNLGDLQEYKKKVLRHEIVHAFLKESGLVECSGMVECWAMNETMVDWIACQGLKIHKAWLDGGAI